MSGDPTNPHYYANRTIEPIDVIEDWVLPHHLACVVKYIARYREKGEAIQDLSKAQWYLTRFVGLMLKLQKDSAKPVDTRKHEDQSS